MGAIYKRKRHSCAMCKPHKMGWADKKKIKERKEIEEFKKQKRQILKGDLNEQTFLG